MPATPATVAPSLRRRTLRVLGEAFAWTWFALSGLGGFGLILTTGALPFTHGWYAMFSGIALCPATAWLVKRATATEPSYPTRFLIALSIILAGRLALIVRVWPFG
ncbi:MAG: hypothetical protein ISS15_04705 [Alphaproteobacteria bacterium]|nr:hypothetical protein [Alphaproteobacteria bacterium]MBL7096940.1 hypothetical protein [Alphaproteobacteria bacterium]